LTEAAFEVAIGPAEAKTFAELSGDWNPLHTDAAYAATTEFGRPILHGAFSAGLVSRMAGMHIPGTDCLLHGMTLKFLLPIVLPARLRVRGQLTAERGETGRVDVQITDAADGRRFVEASYDFSRHHKAESPAGASGTSSERSLDTPAVLITGASGGIGQALFRRIGSAALGVSRGGHDGLVAIPDLERASEVIGTRKVSAIVHCGWPSPDNTRLIRLADTGAAIDHHVSQPLRDMIALARLLNERGTEDALLLLVGSTAADPGRHNYRMPLYTLAKSMVPTLCRILAIELGASGRRCAAVVFDVVNTGMNKAMSPQAKLAHQDRSPSGRIPLADEAAEQLAWMLENRSFLASGAVVSLSGGALP
jgi:3-hydroxybutyryl-CoA dehydratase